MACPYTAAKKVVTEDLPTAVVAVGLEGFAKHMVRSFFSFVVRRFDPKTSFFLAGMGYGTYDSWRCDCWSVYISGCEGKNCKCGKEGEIRDGETLLSFGSSVGRDNGGFVRRRSLPEEQEKVVGFTQQ